MKNKGVSLQTRNETSNHRLMGMGSVALASVLWSTAGLMLKWVPWNPAAIAGIRGSIAATVLLIYWLAKYKKLPPLPTRKKALGVVNYMILVMLFISANKLTTAANAILLQFTSPIWVIVLARLFLKEPMRRSGMITSLVVLLGMGLFFFDNLSLGGMLGNCLAVLSGIAMAVMVVSLKGVKTGSPLEIIFWGNVFTFLAGIPFYGGIEISAQSVMAIGLLGIFQVGIAYIFYCAGIKRLSALEGILITVLEPLLNPVWVLLLYGEALSVSALVGGVIVIAAVLFQSVHDQRKCVQQLSVKQP